MACADCGTTSPEPFEAYGEGDKATTAYWFLVDPERPVEAVGIESDGDLAFRFRICKTLEHPVPEGEEEVLCADCFDRRYPLVQDKEEGEPNV